MSTFALALTCYIAGAVSMATTLLVCQRLHAMQPKDRRTPLNGKAFAWMDERDLRDINARMVAENRQASGRGIKLERKAFDAEEANQGRNWE